VTVERFCVQGLEYVLAPGLNLLVCPSDPALNQVYAALCEQAAAMLPAPLDREAWVDAFTFTPGDWRALGRHCALRPVGEVLVAQGMLGGRRYPGVRHRLLAELSEIWAPRASGPALNRTLAALGRTQKDLRALGDPQARVRDLREKSRALGARCDAAAAQLQRLEEEAALASRLDAALPALGTLDGLLAERASLGEVADFPRDGQGRLEAQKRALAEAEAERARLLAQVPAKAARPSGADPEAVVDRISVLLDVHRLWDVQLRALPERIDATARRRSVAEAEGPQPSGPDAVTAYARCAALSLEDARAALAHRRAFDDTARAVRERVEAEIRRLTSEALALSPTADRARLRAERDALDELPRLREAADGARRAQQAAQKALEDRQRSREPRPGELFGLPAAVAGGTCALAAGLAGAALSGMGWPALLLGGAAAAGAGGLHALSRARHRTTMQAFGARAALFEADVQRLTADVRARTADRDAAAAALRQTAGVAKVSEDATAERLEARAHALWASMEEVARREAVGRQLEAYAALMATAAAAEQRARVDRHVAEARVSTLERELAAGDGGSLRQLPALRKKRALSLRVEEGALAADWQACARAGEVLLAAARALGVSVRDLGAVPFALESLQSALGAQAEQLRAERKARLEVLARLTRCLAERADAADAVVSLLRHGRAGDEADFARKSQKAARLDRLEVERVEAVAAVEASARMPLEEVRAQLAAHGGAGALARRRSRLAERVTRLRGQLGRLAEERSRAEAELTAWERGDAVQTLRAREATLDAEARTLLERWARARLALGMVEARVTGWRRRRRERVVALASRELGRLTDGAWVHLGLTGEDDDSLIATDAELRQVPASALAGPVRELAALAFRLAALEEHAQRQVAPPLIFAGALAGFEPDSLGRIARVLGGLSEARQVVVLTRRPLVRELFEAHGAHGVELDELTAHAG
jgi:uncharacterized protein YhaN